MSRGGAAEHHGRQCAADLGRGGLRWKSCEAAEQHGGYPGGTELLHAEEEPATWPYCGMMQRPQWLAMRKPEMSSSHTSRATEETLEVGSSMCPLQPGQSVPANDS